MKIKFLIIAFILSLNACAQVTPSEKQNNNKTRILGTRIYLENPDNFKPSQDFIGLESEQTVIQFVDLYGGDYGSNAKNFTKKNFESKGINVLKFKELKINNYDAKLALLQGTPNQKSLQLVFGDGEFSAMVMAFIPNFEEENIKKIENALLTIEYDKERVVDPFEIAFFELDDSKSSFKYSKTISNMFLYTKGGIKKDDYVGESAYLVSQIPTDRPNMNPELIHENNLNSLKNNGLIVYNRKVSNRKKLNGSDCYEELITGSLNDEETQIKMISIVKGSHVVQINAVMKNDFESTLEEFEKLTSELKMK
ncbi:hypothetical protein H0I23_02835 [Cellulophaga sp. HaHaR_3_176]|uniref:hypothetical protein n=1 Tax=Cellulophaga sp. HaHaR_3_176 TaxID=1942464 RepID=UPI001C1F3DC9|nr:hypothetical protein [Cellulophaga sp. HaHaR_3_176]QWX84599.1 hypothetical protein H0I23_02835 [Cellulophaga sp. HaHaR_3_176]